MSDHGQLEDTFLKEKSGVFFWGCVLVFFGDFYDREKGMVGAGKVSRLE